MSENGKARWGRRLTISAVVAIIVAGLYGAFHALLVCRFAAPLHVAIPVAFVGVAFVAALLLMLFCGQESNDASTIALMVVFAAWGGLACQQAIGLQPHVGSILAGILGIVIPPAGAAIIIAVIVGIGLLWSEVF